MRPEALFFEAISLFGLIVAIIGCSRLFGIKFHKWNSPTEEMQRVIATRQLTTIGTILMIVGAFATFVFVNNPPEQGNEYLKYDGEVIAVHGDTIDVGDRTANKWLSFDVSALADSGAIKPEQKVKVFYENVDGDYFPAYRVVITVREES